MVIDKISIRWPEDFVCSDNFHFNCVQIPCRYRTFLRFMVIDKISIRWSEDFVCSDNFYFNCLQDLCSW